jgi:hypothetical protein
MKFKLGPVKIEVTGRDATKKVVGWTASYGAGIIILAAIKQHIPGDLKIHKAAAVAVGTWALASMAKDAVEDHTDKLVDLAFDGVETIKKIIRETQQKVSETKAA